MLLFNKPWKKILPYGCLALLAVLIIFDTTADAEQANIHQVNEVKEIPMQGVENLQTKNIHIVQSGEN